MTKLERKAALAVAAATAGVIVSGVSLIRKHARYLTQKAAATFDPQDEDRKRRKQNDYHIKRWFNEGVQSADVRD